MSSLSIQTVRERIQPSCTVLFCLDPLGIEWCPPTLGRASCFTLCQCKCSVSPHAWASCGQVKLTHTGHHYTGSVALTIAEG